jgi:hypothetical protein
MSTVTDHRIEVPPALPPTVTTVRCCCGDWSRTYTTDREWSDTLDAARSHVASNCGDFEREDNGHTGNITIHGRP